MSDSADAAHGSLLPQQRPRQRPRVQPLNAVESQVGHQDLLRRGASSSPTNANREKRVKSSADQVGDSATIDGLSKGLIAYWSFDDGTASDLSGHKHDGVLSGCAQIVNGVIGRALRFTGGCSIAIAGDDLGFTYESEKSIAVWIRPDSVGDNDSGIISKYRHFQVSQSNFYASIFLSRGQLWTRLTGSGSGVVDVKIGRIGEWQHLVFIMKSGNGNSRIFYNGSLVASGDLIYNSTISKEPLRIGDIVGDDDQTFRGDLDEIRIYDRELSEGEIRQLANKIQKVPLHK
jgi:hypothetical protein